MTYISRQFKKSYFKFLIACLHGRYWSEGFQGSLNILFGLFFFFPINTVMVVPVCSSSSVMYSSAQRICKWIFILYFFV